MPETVTITILYDHKDRAGQPKLLVATTSLLYYIANLWKILFHYNSLIDLLVIVNRISMHGSIYAYPVDTLFRDSRAAARKSREDTKTSHSSFLAGVTGGSPRRYPR